MNSGYPSFPYENFQAIQQKPSRFQVVLKPAFACYFNQLKSRWFFAVSIEVVSGVFNWFQVVDFE
jgi:hypothetical protein